MGSSNSFTDTPSVGNEAEDSERVVDQLKCRIENIPTFEVVGLLIKLKRAKIVRRATKILRSPIIRINNGGTLSQRQKCNTQWQ